MPQVRHYLSFRIGFPWNPPPAIKKTAGAIWQIASFSLPFRFSLLHRRMSLIYSKYLSMNRRLIILSQANIETHSRMRSSMILKDSVFRKEQRTHTISPERPTFLSLPCNPPQNQHRRINLGKRRTGQSLRLQNNALLCHRCGITCHSGLASHEIHRPPSRKRPVPYGRLRVSVCRSDSLYCIVECRWYIPNTYPWIGDL